MRIRREDRVGWMENRDIPGLEKYGGGHFVYVKRKYPNGKSKIHTISAIEHWKRDGRYQIPIRIKVKSKDGDANVTSYVSEKKLVEMRNGRVHPIPHNESNLNLWSGFYLDEKTVDSSKIKKPLDGNGNVTHKFIKKRNMFPLRKEKIKKHKK